MTIQSYSSTPRRSVWEICKDIFLQDRYEVRRLRELLAPTQVINSSRIAEVTVVGSHLSGKSTCIRASVREAILTDEQLDRAKNGLIISNSGNHSQNFQMNDWERDLASYISALYRREQSRMVWHLAMSQEDKAAKIYRDMYNAVVLRGAPAPLLVFESWRKQGSYPSKQHDQIIQEQRVGDEEPAVTATMPKYSDQRAKTIHVNSRPAPKPFRYVDGSTTADRIVLKGMTVEQVERACDDSLESVREYFLGIDADEQFKRKSVWKGLIKSVINYTGGHLGSLHLVLKALIAEFDRPQAIEQLAKFASDGSANEGETYCDDIVHKYLNEQNAGGANITDFVLNLMHSVGLTMEHIKDPMQIQTSIREWLDFEELLILGGDGKSKTLVALFKLLDGQLDQNENDFEDPERQAIKMLSSDAFIDRDLAKYWVEFGDTNLSYSDLKARANQEKIQIAQLIVNYVKSNPVRYRDFFGKIREQHDSRANS